MSAAIPVLVALLLPLALGSPEDVHRRAEGLAPVMRPSINAEIVPNSYIVVWKPELHGPGSAKFTSRIFADVGVRAGVVFDSPLLYGVSIDLNEQQLHKMRRRPEVAYIEHDRFVRLAEQGQPSQLHVVEQKDASWGLTRISDPRPGARGYRYVESAGQGVCVYIIDTGIDTDHAEFEGRAEFLVDVTGENNRGDIDGHGTHVAGIVGSRQYGVAKKAKILSIKSFVMEKVDKKKRQLFGRVSWNLLGLEKVARDAGRRRATGKDCAKGVILNLSFVSDHEAQGDSQVFDEKLSQLARGDFVVVAAAGNDKKDAAGYTPAHLPDVCTVSAMTIHNTPWEGANWGPAVDVYAPGEHILSTWPGGGSKVKSGTSMAAPFVVGAAAVLRSYNDTIRHQDTCGVIRSMAHPDVLRNVPGKTRNLLLSTNAR